MVSKGTVIYVAAFALLLTWALFVQTDTRRVSGTSMLPTLEGGDLLVVQSVPINQIHVGDIIVYGGLCSVGAESVVHRVVNITAQGLITKGDNNQQTDQFYGIAVSPITPQCLEGKVVFVVPYVEILAYSLDQACIANYGTPNCPLQWLNYAPSLLILIVVILSMLREDHGEPHESKQSTPPGTTNPSP